MSLLGNIILPQRKNIYCLPFNSFITLFCFEGTEILQFDVFNTKNQVI